MMTALAVPPAAADAETEPPRLLPISVNLLPEEIVLGRAARSARRLTIGVLVAALLASGGWYYSAMSDTDDASAALAAARDQATVAGGKKDDFTTLNKVKSEIDNRKGQLSQAMTGDVAWNRVMPALRAAQPDGVKLVTVSAKAASAQDASLAGAGGLSTTGTLSISGTAKTKDLASTYADALNKLTLVTDADLTSVAGDSESKGYQFTIQASTTKTALNTRYPKAGK